jgi:hypothetical protein
VSERAKSAQNGRHKAPHQGAVAIGKRFQSRMRGGAIQLFVQRAVLMQHAIENIRGDPARRETWDLGWQCEFLRRHGVGTFSASWTAQAFNSHHRTEITFATGICQM